MQQLLINLERKHMKKTLLALALVTAPFAVSAKYYTQSYADPMTDEESVFAYDVDHVNQIGLRCDKGESLMLTFSSTEHVATPNAGVSVMIRVDKNKARSFIARTFSNSYTSGYLSNPNRYLLRELVQGEKALVRIEKYGRPDVDYSIDLSGVSAAYGEVLASCGIELPKQGTDEIKELCLNQVLHRYEVYKEGLSDEELTAMYTAKTINFNTYREALGCFD